MKKIIACMLALCMIASLVGCGSQNSTGNVVQNTYSGELVDILKEDGKTILRVETADDAEIDFTVSDMSRLDEIGSNLIKGQQVEIKCEEYYPDNGYRPLLAIKALNQSNDINELDKTPTFSYEEVLEVYKENDAGVKHDGFVNTSETNIDDEESAIARAKNECTITYDTAKCYYDSMTKMWMVAFYTAGTLGNEQDVYLNCNGITTLIVYGE